MTKYESIIEKEIKKKVKGKDRDIDKLTVGSTVRVNTRIKEGGKERIQAFEGILISKKGKGVNAMFTIRKIASGGIGVERTFPIYSPSIESIKIIKEGKAKRAKLYYLRDAFGKRAKKETRRFTIDEIVKKEEKVEELNRKDVEEKVENKGDNKDNKSL